VFFRSPQSKATCHPTRGENCIRSLKECATTRSPIYSNPTFADGLRCARNVRKRQPLRVGDHDIGGKAVRRPPQLEASPWLTLLKAFYEGDTTSPLRRPPAQCHRQVLLLRITAPSSARLVVIGTIVSPAGFAAPRPLGNLRPRVFRLESSWATVLPCVEERS
jgi:hypothetical protein